MLEAELMAKAAHAVAQRHYGNSSLDAVTVQLDLATIKFEHAKASAVDAQPAQLLASQRRHSEAIALFEDAYWTRQRALGTDHRSTLRARALWQKCEASRRDPFAPPPIVKRPE